MTFCIYDADGYVGDIGTGKGVSALLGFLREQESPVLKDLGGTLAVGANPDSLAAIDALPIPDDRELASTVRQLQKLAKECDEVIIFSDGMEPSDG